MKTPIYYNIARKPQPFTYRTGVGFTPEEAEKNSSLGGGQYGVTAEMSATYFGAKYCVRKLARRLRKGGMNGCIT